MENSKKNRYSIDINNKKYIFSCNDGQDHVNKLRDIVSETIESLPSHDFSLSDQAVKIALLLADENIGAKKIHERRLKEIENRIKLLTDDLDEVLIS